MILISCSSSISKIKVVQQVNQPKKQPHLPMIQNKILWPKVSERHPIKTGADNYTYTYPLKEKK
jgi:hypothetical protein